MVRWTPTTVGHAPSQESDDESHEAGEDGDQREGSSGLDVGGHRIGVCVPLALHLTRGLHHTVQPEAVPHLQDLKRF